MTFTSGDSMELLLFDRNTRVVIRKAEGTLKKVSSLSTVVPLDSLLCIESYVWMRQITIHEGHNRYGTERVPKEWVLGVVTEIYRKDRHIFVTD